MDEKLYEFLSAVFTYSIMGLPYSYLEHDDKVVTNAVEGGYVKPVDFHGYKAIAFTTKGHLAYCGECARREGA